MPSDDLWTVREAAELLDPPLTPAHVREMIDLIGVTAAGTRRTPGHAGRPAAVYPAGDLLRAHAIVVDARAQYERKTT